VRVASTCVGSGKGPTTLDLMYAAFPCISARGCFQDLNPLTSWSQDNSFTAAPGLPFHAKMLKKEKNDFFILLRPVLDNV
jgi:hypothetical protein